MNFHTLNLLMRYAKAYGHKEIRVLGLSETEHTICTFLFGHSGVSQDDVSDALRLDRTTVARALLTLEEKRMVTRRRNPQNRRKNLLYLTEEGRKSMAEVVGIYDRWLAGISACLSEEEQTKFDDCCSRLLAAAKAAADE